LRNQKAKHKTIEINCVDQASCTYADQFVNIFRDAGWTVEDNKPHPVLAEHPKAGIWLYRRGEGRIDPSNWQSGLWGEVTASILNVHQAFLNIDIDTDAETNPNLPPDVLAILFGIEKPDEREQTAFSTFIAQNRSFVDKEEK
jgi:hypothetical protein